MTRGDGALRLLYLGTGGFQVMHMPDWITWLGTAHPSIEVRPCLSTGALRLVASAAVDATSRSGPAFVDEWGNAPSGAIHVELAEWADGAIVHPASMNFVARFANGFADTPVLNALQCTTAPVVVCPGLPPGGAENPAYRRHVAWLAERPNVSVLSPTIGGSATTGKVGVGATVEFSMAMTELLEMIEDGE